MRIRCVHYIVLKLNSKKIVHPKIAENGIKPYLMVDPDPGSFDGEENWLYKQFFLGFLTTESDLRTHGKFHFLKPINQFIEPMRRVIEIEAIVGNLQYREISLSKTSTI